jgi:CheY-like chemotaxis protein/DNA-binding CsgD family transcriptional regulator
MERYKILIVDDIIENLRIMVSVFEKHLPHYELFQTNDPEKALEIAKQILPDLVITDWDMPRLSGIALIHRLKRSSETKDIPVIMATGVMLSPDDLEKAFSAGAIDYLRKPINATELIARTNSALLVTKYYKQIVAQKDHELTESALYLVKVQEFNNSFAKKLDALSQLVTVNPESVISQLQELKEDMIQHSNQESWYRFNLSFSNVHKDFTRELTERHPTITPAELKLCSFIRLGMANKEIASLLNQTSDSIKVSSYRIRKKFNLEGNINLRSYLSQF